MTKRTLITSALPYANGPLHFGHLAGAYLPADVFFRHKKMVGDNVVHICGSDEHGVAIMLNAQKAGVSYKEYVDKWHVEHGNLFTKYDVHFDIFGQTSASYHQKEVVEWFTLLNEKGFIETRESKQLYCNDCRNHLPDRFVEGECYSCGYEKARGDECPQCGIWIEPEKLLHPECQICKSKNVSEVTVSQYYLLLSKFHKEYRQWFESKREHWRRTVFPYVDSLTKEGLQDRAITRDLDWGIDVPLPEAKGKKLYVWFDAPIGYVSNTKELMEKRGEDYLKDWWCHPETEIVNFIGKDNIIFHAIIFPVMSMASGRVSPVHSLAANQYLNLEGKQFSKSSGHYVDASGAVDEFGADALRYYLLAISPESSDSSFSWEGFAAKINGELANNIGNLVNRCLKFWAKNWPEGVSCDLAKLLESEEGKKLVQGLKEHKELLENIEIKKGLEKAMSLGHEANLYFSERAPWAVFKEDTQAAQKIIAETGVFIIAVACSLSCYLPSLAEKILGHFGEGLTADICSQVYCGNLNALTALFSRPLVLTGAPKALVPKIEEDRVKELTAELGKL